MEIATIERQNPMTLSALTLAAALAISGVAFVPAALTPYVIAAGLLAIVGMFTFLNTLFLLYFIIFTSSMAGLFRGLDTLDLGETALTVSGLRWVAVAGLGALLLVANAFRLRVPKHYLPFVLFVGWTLIRASVSPVGVAGLKDVLFYGMPLIVGLYTLNIAPKLESSAVYTRIEKVLLYSALVPPLLYLITIPAGLVEYTENGPKGLVGPRPVASYLLIVLALALAQWRYGRTVSARGRGAFICLIAMLTIFFTLSRTAGLTAVVLLALSKLDTFRPTRLVVGVLAVVVMSLSIFWAVPPLRQRMFHSAPTNAREAIQQFDMSGRDKMWPLTFVHAAQRPVVGWGPGSARRLVGGMFAEKEESTKGAEVHPHNEYLQVFHDLGIIGLALLLLAWVPLFFHYLRSWKSSERARGDPQMRKWNMAATLAIFMVLASSLTGNSMHYAVVTAPAFIIVGCAGALNVAAHNRATRLRTET